MRSDYSYNIRIVKNSPFLMIEDLNLGRMSVTNNIENVIGEIARKEIINPVEYYIIYKDSCGEWDGFIFALKVFVLLHERHWLKAAIKFLNYKN